MASAITTTVTIERCTGCGRCVAVCPYDSLSLEDGKAHVTGELSMHCGQCIAVCPKNAICVPELTSPTPVTIGGHPEAETLFRIVQMRRSCRQYTTTPVSEDHLRDLVCFGQWAPSGTNAQGWRFTLLPDRAAVVTFARAIARFYRRINRQAENPLLRLISRVFLNDVLGRYHRRYYRQIREALDRFEQDGIDLLFHGATAAIVVSVDRQNACAQDDAGHAAQNILLGAQTMGLGSCLIGFAVEAAKRDLSIAEALQIPKTHQIYSVVALGHPQYPPVRPSGRKHRLSDILSLVPTTAASETP